MDASEAPPIKWTTNEILKILGLNTKGEINGIQEDMLMEPKGIRNLNGEDAEGIQVACVGYTKRNLVNERFVVTRVQ